jgi:formylglycine-generating enzyme
MPRLCSSLLLSLLSAWSASAVTMDWTFVGNPGNACDTQPQGCFGTVGYDYLIGTYEVTNAQYAEFLNAKAGADPLGLFNPDMGSFPVGGITRSGHFPHHSYAAIAGRENMPVVFVSFYDALRFANWLHNGQGSGDTETGAYTLEGGTPTPSNAATVTRNPEATIFLPNEDEWYKAAYYDLVSASYFDYPAGSDTPTTCAAPSTTPNTANCERPAFDLTDVGSYTGSASPAGTFDQGGNVLEWNEALITFPGGSVRDLEGGSFDHGQEELAASYRDGGHPTTEEYHIGFRVVPEPSTGLLRIAGLLSVLGLAGWRRVRD